MKTLPAGLQAHLDSGATTLAWCWRITRADGAVFGFTDHDRALAFAGTEFEPDSGFNASEIRAGSELSVDAQDAEGALRSDRITEADILDGRWDNAAIEVWRVNWDAPAQRVLMRRGNIGQIRRGRASFIAEVRSLAHYLNQTVGRTFQFYCDAALGDARCGVDLDAPTFGDTGGVATAIGDRGFRAAAGLSGFAAGCFDLGHLTWTSGANDGGRAEIARHTLEAGAVRIDLFEAPARPIGVGDAFTIRAGCDKQFATCKAKFANAVNFRGFPSMPGDDVVVRYATEPISRKLGEGESLPENVNSTLGSPDFLASLDQLEASAPNCGSASLVVSWFGLDLRAGHCAIRPGVEFNDKTTSPRSWSVNGVSRAAAYEVSRIAGGPAYGGTPADFAVVQAIQELKARGFGVTFYPFVLMDIGAGNTLPNPWSAHAGEAGQPVFPWRGRITCSPAAGFAGSPDKTAGAAAQVAVFFGDAVPSDFNVSGETVSWTGPSGDWGLRRMILHYAHLCAAAGGVDALLIGSEMRGLTQVRSAAGSYPAVQQLRDLAADCRSILGAGTKISYAADWSEYFGHHPDDGTGDVYFHLDPLWADAEIDFVGIDNYMPLSDWREGGDHADALAGAPSIYDLDYLRSNIEGGEGFDWFYASEGDRAAQDRTPISDGLGKPWVFRFKDLRSWWSNPHFNRPGGTESGAPTAWTPESKPIRFTEAGCPAIDKGTNQPNVFFDPKSSESFAPYFSRGFPDDLIQRRYIEALHTYWADHDNNPASGVFAGRMIETGEISIWTWDARPFPAFPARADVWQDNANWQLGHWLTGRLGATGLGELVRELCRRGGLPEGLVDSTRLIGVVPGYTVSGLESARASIEPLARFFAFDGVETGGQLRFVPRGERAVAEIEPGELVAAEQREAEDIAFTRGQETELPRALKWRLTALDEEFGGLTVEARRITVDSARVRSESFPIACSASLADRNARRALFEEWIGREEASFALPPSRLALDPTDVVRILHDGRAPNYALTRISDGDGRRIEARRVDPLIYDLPPGPERKPAVTVPTVLGPPVALLMNLPQLAEDIPAGRPYAAVFARPWYGEAAIWRSATEDGFEFLDALGRPARIGALAFDLYGGPSGRFDLGNEAWIDLPAATLASVTDQALFAGENALAVESAAGVWEVLQFGSAELMSLGRWRLHRLLRGQLGTEEAIGNPAAAGARVVMLDAAVAALSISDADIGLPWNWRIGPARVAAGDPINLAIEFTPEGRGLRPYSPAHLRGTPQPGGAILLSWIRRTRSAAGDSWVLAEAPLGEEHEEYELEILDGSDVVRSVAALTSSSFTYTTAMMTADLGGIVSTVRFRVFQIGALGRGAPAEAWS